MIGRPFSTRLLITIAALLLLPLLPNRLAGQQERQQSGEYATIGGRRVLLHIVQPKETLFSICRAYNVTQQELLKLNPQLAAGLKAGSSIIIRDLSIATQEENDAYLFSSSLSYQREDSTANSAQNAAADTTALSESAEFSFPTQEPAEVFAPLIGKRIERIGVILPLNTATGSFSNNYMDFYAGALLAADEQKR
ncbi:MAG: LysM peptidoglycan-binding domain-containing protein, partial [Bacteroidales bacterium]|nr:LysM peptidoglycan-binding domain-containing protein [Bacteroidales bacterium]